MPKIITPAMRAHLDAETTRLCTAWRIERRDGQSFFFTDHDRDLVCGGKTYLAATGFDRTAISNGRGRDPGLADGNCRWALPANRGLTRPMPFCGACGGEWDDVMAARGRDVGMPAAARKDTPRRRSGFSGPLDAGLEDRGPGDLLRCSVLAAPRNRRAAGSRVVLCIVLRDARINFLNGPFIMMWVHDNAAVALPGWLAVSGVAYVALRSCCRMHDSRS